MTWLTKLFTVGKNSVNAKMNDVVENMIDIKREGNGIILALDKEIKELHLRVEEAQINVQQSKHNINQQQSILDTLNASAVQAVKAKDDIGATSLLARAESVELLINTYKQSTLTIEPIIQSQITRLNKMVVEKELLGNEIARLDLEERDYKARAKLLGGADTKDSIDLNFLRERVNKARATCEAREILKDQIVDTSSDTLQTSTSNVSVQQKLEALKEQYSN